MIGEEEEDWGIEEVFRDWRLQMSLDSRGTACQWFWSFGRFLPRSGGVASHKLGTQLAWLVELGGRREVNVSLMSFIMVCRWSWFLFLKKKIYFPHLTWQTSLVIRSFQIQFSSIQAMIFLGVYGRKIGRLEMMSKVCSSILVLWLYQDPGWSLEQI